MLHNFSTAIVDRFVLFRKVARDGESRKHLHDRGDVPSRRDIKSPAYAQVHVQRASNSLRLPPFIISGYSLTHFSIFVPNRPLHQLVHQPCKNEISPSEKESSKFVRA